MSAMLAPKTKWRTRGFATCATLNTGKSLLRCKLTFARHIPDTLPGRSFEPNGSDIVLVTGATGLVGSAIVVKLLKAERQVGLNKLSSL